MWIREYGELIKILTISDLKVKYQNSVLGFAWSLLNPLLMMLVLYAVFNNVFQSKQEHFALYILTGLATWRFFSIGTSSAMYAIAGRPSLVTKIYIPRQVLVLSTVLSSTISSFLEFLVLIVLLPAFGGKIYVTIVLLPVLHALYFVLIYGICLMLSALYVYYRDLNQIWEVLMQLGFFLSPVVYPVSIVPKSYLGYYSLNPVTAAMNAYRDALIYGIIPDPQSIAILITAGLVVGLIGSAIFKRLERRFAEEL